MSEREQKPLKTVSDFRVRMPEELVKDGADPEGRITHESETGEEPAYVDKETLLSEEKLETGQVQQEQTQHRLDELVKDFYMFSLAPVYFTCLWDKQAGRIKFDLIHRFSVEMKMARPPRVVHYQCKTPLFRGGGAWDVFLQGLPRQDNMEYLFSKWVEQLVFVDRNSRPMQYWRVNTKHIRVAAPALAATPVQVDIFLPTGVDKRLDTQPRPDGSHEYIQLPPEDWVIEESMRYFGGVDA